MFANKRRYIIVIVNSKLLKRYSKAKRTRAPAYSRALRRIKGRFPKGGQEKLRSEFQSTRRVLYNYVSAELYRGVHPSRGHDAFSPLFQISHLFSKNFQTLWKFLKMLPFPEKFLDFHPSKFLMTYFSHRPQISNLNSPPVSVHFPIGVNLSKILGGGARSGQSSMTDDIIGVSGAT